MIGVFVMHGKVPAPSNQALDDLIAVMSTMAWAATMFASCLRNFFPK